MSSPSSSKRSSTSSSNNARRLVSFSYINGRWNYLSSVPDDADSIAKNTQREGKVMKNGWGSQELRSYFVRNNNNNNNNNSSSSNNSSTPSSPASPSASGAASSSFSAAAAAAAGKSGSHYRVLALFEGSFDSEGRRHGWGTLRVFKSVQNNNNNSNNNNAPLVCISLACRWVADVPQIEWDPGRLVEEILRNPQQLVLQQNENETENINESSSSLSKTIEPACEIYNDCTRRIISVYNGLMLTISEDFASDRFSHGLLWSHSTQFLPHTLGEKHDLLIPSPNSAAGFVPAAPQGGVKFCGQWQMGERHGFGMERQISTGGLLYAGPYESGVRHGVGLLFHHQSKTCLDATWNRGRIADCPGALHIQGFPINVLGRWSGDSTVTQGRLCRSNGASGLWEMLFADFDEQMASLQEEIEAMMQMKQQRQNNHSSSSPVLSAASSQNLQMSHASFNLSGQLPTSTNTSPNRVPIWLSSSSTTTTGTSQNRLKHSVSTLSTLMTSLFYHHHHHQLRNSNLLSSSSSEMSIFISDLRARILAARDEVAAVCEPIGCALAVPQMRSLLAVFQRCFLFSYGSCSPSGEDVGGGVMTALDMAAATPLVSVGSGAGGSSSPLVGGSPSGTTTTTVTLTDQSVVHQQHEETDDVFLAPKSSLSWCGLAVRDMCQRNVFPNEFMTANNNSDGDGDLRNYSNSAPQHQQSQLLCIHRSRNSRDSELEIFTRSVEDVVALVISVRLRLMNLANSTIIGSGGNGLSSPSSSFSAEKIIHHYQQQQGNNNNNGSGLSVLSSSSSMPSTARRTARSISPESSSPTKTNDNNTTTNNNDIDVNTGTSTPIATSHYDGLLNLSLMRDPFFVFVTTSSTSEQEQEQESDNTSTANKNTTVTDDDNNNNNNNNNINGNNSNLLSMIKFNTAFCSPQIQQLALSGTPLSPSARAGVCSWDAALDIALPPLLKHSANVCKIDNAKFILAAKRLVTYAKSFHPQHHTKNSSTTSKKKQNNSNTKSSKSQKEIEASLMEKAMELLSVLLPAKVVRDAASSSCSCSNNDNNNNDLFSSPSSLLVVSLQRAITQYASDLIEATRILSNCFTSSSSAADYHNGTSLSNTTVAVASESTQSGLLFGCFRTQHPPPPPPSHGDTTTATMNNTNSSGNEENKQQQQQQKFRSNKAERLRRVGVDGAVSSLVAAATSCCARIRDASTVFAEVVANAYLSDAHEKFVALVEQKQTQQQELREYINTLLTTVIHPRQILYQVGFRFVVCFAALTTTAPRSILPQLVLLDSICEAEAPEKPFAKPYYVSSPSSSSSSSSRNTTTNSNSSNNKNNNTGTATTTQNNNTKIHPHQWSVPVTTMMNSNSGTPALVSKSIYQESIDEMSCSLLGLWRSDGGYGASSTSTGSNNNNNNSRSSNNNSYSNSSSEILAHAAVSLATGAVFPVTLFGQWAIRSLRSAILEVTSLANTPSPAVSASSSSLSCSSCHSSKKNKTKTKPGAQQDDKEDPSKNMEASSSSSHHDQAHHQYCVCTHFTSLFTCDMKGRVETFLRDFTRPPEANPVASSPSFVPYQQQQATPTHSRVIINPVAWFPDYRRTIRRPAQSVENSGNTAMQEGSGNGGNGEPVEALFSNSFAPGGGGGGAGGGGNDLYSTAYTNHHHTYDHLQYDSPSTSNYSSPAASGQRGANGTNNNNNNDNHNNNPSASATATNTAVGATSASSSKSEPILDQSFANVVDKAMNLLKASSKNIVVSTTILNQLAASTQQQLQPSSSARGSGTSSSNPGTFSARNHGSNTNTAVATTGATTSSAATAAAAVASSSIASTSSSIIIPLKSEDHEKELMRRITKLSIVLKDLSIRTEMTVKQESMTSSSDDDDDNDYDDDGDDDLGANTNSETGGTSSSSQKQKTKTQQQTPNKKKKKNMFEDSSDSSSSSSSSNDFMANNKKNSTKKSNSFTATKNNNNSNNNNITSTSSNVGGRSTTATVRTKASTVNTYQRMRLLSTIQPASGGGHYQRKLIVKFSSADTHLGSDTLAEFLHQEEGADESTTTPRSRSSPSSHHTGGACVSDNDNDHDENNDNEKTKTQNHEALRTTKELKQKRLQRIRKLKKQQQQNCSSIDEDAMESILEYWIGRRRIFQKEK